MAKLKSKHAHASSELWSRPGLKRAFEKARKQLGQRLKDIRAERELTQEQVAEKAAIHPKHLQRLENGRGNVTLATLVAISKALGVTVEELFQVKKAK